MVKLTMIALSQIATMVLPALRSIVSSASSWAIRKLTEPGTTVEVTASRNPQSSETEVGTELIRRICQSI